MPTSRRAAGVAATLALAAALALSGCLHGADSRGADDPVTVYVSLPLRGPSGDDGRDAADGARLALAEAGGAAGGHEVSAVFLDDTEGRDATARWSPAQVGRNARRATRDASAIAYIGELESGATRTSLPITNEARILQVSPASSASDLVRQPGTFEGVPEELQPSGERTFGRVIPGDVAQARTGAEWAAEIGGEQVAVVVERTAFGRSIADAFVDQGTLGGLDVERSRFDRSLSALNEEGDEGGVADLCAAAAETVDPPRARSFTYFAGADRRALAIFGCLPPAGRAFMGTDALLPYVESLRALDVVSEIYLTSAAQDPSQLPPAGQDFVERFRREHDREPERYAAYGYEAMAAVLDSIERAGAAGADRTEVIDAFLAITDRESILGTYSIESTGETTLDRLTGYRADRGRARPVSELRAPGR
jgi:branched-chain amino acid transport system substrate-binding protein